jgi:hypothetical protein
MLDNLISGSIAGGIGAFGVLPIDITKTHVQSSITNNNAWNIIRQIYKTNRFAKGDIWRVLKSGLSEPHKIL